jgi:hypothetical protein
MKAVARRKLTVLDAMILVAVTAGGIVAARAYYFGAADSSSVSHLRSVVNSWERWLLTVSLYKTISTPVQPPDSSTIAATRLRIAAYERRMDIDKIFSSLNIFLSIMTIAIVSLALREPRPRVRRLVHDPGFAACSTAISILAVRTISAIVWWAAALGGDTRLPWAACVGVFDDLEGYVGAAIVAVWMIIAISGRGRSDWSSIGWLTMLMAVAWVMLIFRNAAICVVAPL